MSRPHIYPMAGISVAAALLAVLLAFPDAVQAGRRGNALTGIAIGVGVLGVMNELSKASNAVPPNKPRPPRKETSTPSGGSGSKSESGSKKEAAAPPPAPASEAVLKDIAAKREELQAFQAAQLEDRQRDVDRAIDIFLATLKSFHTDLRNSPRVHAAALNDINQVTKAEVRIAVEDAYKNTNLSLFDRVPGDLWTKERIMVLVLTQSRPGLRPFFDGVGAKGPSMDDIRRVIADAAAIVYSRTLEANELLGVSYSYDRLIRVIYEHSDGPIGFLVGADADEKLEQIEAATLGTSRLQVAGRSDVFANRYRARRILFDCLTSGLPSIPGSSDRDGKTIPVNQRQETASLPVGRAAASAPTRQETLPKAGDAGQASPPIQLEMLERWENTAEANRFWQQTRSFIEATCKPIISEIVAAKFDPVPARAQWEGHDVTLDGQVINVSAPTQR